MAEVIPVTVIVRHPRESPRKCSVFPLKGRPDLYFTVYPSRPPFSLDGYVRLAAVGPPLSAGDRDRGILLLDGSWNWADVMNRDYLDVPARSLSGYSTAYPRRSKQGTDPACGLASVEALYLAYHILGRPVDGLLDTYYWKDEFLRINEMSQEAKGT